MIPKKIHYCWFGRAEKPKLAQKCIASWQRLCPEYEIIEWNEENFNIDYNEYTRYCYHNKKWAFLSDYVRLLVVAQNGGMYFDTDVELLRKPDELLAYDAFYGFENTDHISTGLGFGAKSNHPTLVEMIKEYDEFEPNEDGKFDFIGCPIINTKCLLEWGATLDGSRQNVSGVEILPVEYFNPYDDPTGRLNATENTISVHWYSKSWMSKSTILRSKITKPFHRIFGNDCFEWLKRIIK